MDCKDAGKRGAEVVMERYGPEFYKALSAKGNAAKKAKAEQIKKELQEYWHLKEKKEE